MSSRTNTYIFDRQKAEYVDAVLIDGLTKDDVDAAERVWKPDMDRIVQKMKEAGEDPPEHAHWDWRKKYDALSDILLFQFLGIECAGQMQGMMLLETAGVYCLHADRRGLGLVYVAFLASAPWNSSEVVPEPRYKQVGTVLIRAAIGISLDLGFEGCIGLHSLPQSEAWYTKRCGMTDLDIDEKKGLRYFEMTVEQATAFMEGN